MKNRRSPEARFTAPAIDFSLRLRPRIRHVAGVAGAPQSHLFARHSDRELCRPQKIEE